MENTTLTVRMDKELKEAADKLFNDLGFTMSSAITVFFKQAVETKSIPFEISKNPLKNRDLEWLRDLLVSKGALESLSSINSESTHEYNATTSIDEI